MNVSNNWNRILQIKNVAFSFYIFLNFFIVFEITKNKIRHFDDFNQIRFINFSFFEKMVSHNLPIWFFWKQIRKIK